VNDLQPDIVVVTGDLTSMGYRQEFREAREYLDRLACPDVLVVPGNHDSRNVGYAHFERLFATRRTTSARNGVTLRGGGLHRTGPGLRPDRAPPLPGESGRRSWSIRRTSRSSFFIITSSLSQALGGSGTSSTTPETCSKYSWSGGVDLVLVGAQASSRTRGIWRTCTSSTRGRSRLCAVRGDTKPCYNVVDIKGEHIIVTRHFPFHGSEAIVEFERAAGPVG